MASGSSLNAEVTDSVAQTNLQVLGLSPAVATSNLYQATAQAMANAAHNGTQTQQAGDTLLQSVSATGSALVLSLAPSGKPSGS